MMQNCQKFMIDFGFYHICQIFAKLFAKNMKVGSDNIGSIYWRTANLGNAQINTVYWIREGESVALGGLGLHSSLWSHVSKVM